jgi:hypothetical protein
MLTLVKRRGAAMRMIVLAVLGLAAMGLGGCNIVTSDTPMFTAADAHGQAQMRPGVWTDEQQACDFDAKAPVDTWPNCARGWVVTPGGVTGPREPGQPRSAWVESPTVLAAGDPPVLQVRADVGESLPARTLPSYIYAGVRALKLDAEGRIVEIETWPAQCGPPPPPGPDGKGGDRLTNDPIPGLVVDREKNTCKAVTPQPLRVSARRSEAWATIMNRSRWVRDGER